MTTTYQIVSPEFTLVLSWDDSEPEKTTPPGMWGSWLTCHGHNQVAGQRQCQEQAKWAGAHIRTIDDAREEKDFWSWHLNSEMVSVRAGATLAEANPVQLARAARARGDYAAALRAVKAL